MALPCNPKKLLAHGWLAGYDVVFNKKPNSGVISDDIFMYFNTHITKRRLRDYMNETLAFDWDDSIEKDLLLRYSLKGFYGAITHYESDLKISEAMEVFSKKFRVEQKHLKDIDIWT